MKKIVCILFLFKCSLSFGQLTNGGFETWDTTYAAGYSSQLISLFGVQNPMGGEITGWERDNTFGKCRTTDSYSGNYAVVLHNWYQYAFGWLTYHDSINSRPHYLQGMFKYITGGIDGLSQGGVLVTLTHFNGTSSDTIGTGSYLFDSTADYTPFQVPLNYSSVLTPDSITLYFVNSYTIGTQVVSHLLYLDDLRLSNVPLQVQQIHPNNLSVFLFPNPAHNELNILTGLNGNFQFAVFNSLGDRIMDTNLNGCMNRIDLSGFTGGFYFYTLRTDNRLIRSGKFIRQ